MAKAPPRQAFRKLVLRTLPGVRQAPFPGFIEPMHPTQHAKPPAGARWQYGPISFAQLKAPLPRVVTGAPLIGAASSAQAISLSEITVIDGDTIRARGRTVRFVVFDAPESGSLAKCDRERQTADRAAAHMRSLLAGGGLELRLVRCSCRPDTEGASLPAL
jgi:endonuclease YncB( thermonuclease family)